RRVDSVAVQVVDTLSGTALQVSEWAELDRVRRARFGARRLPAALEPVVAQRALVRVTGRLGQSQLHNPERTRGHAIAAAVADVVLHDDRAELGSEQRSGRASLQTPGSLAVLAHVAHHQPGALEGRHLGDARVPLD